MGFSRQVHTRARCRPRFILADAEAQERAFKKGGFGDILKATAAPAHPDKRQAPALMKPSARVGNKGRVCHRWWRKRGERAPGTRQIGYQWAYIFSAVPRVNSGAWPVSL